MKRGRKSKENGGGDCYEAAGNLIMSPKYKDFILVHGQVTGQGAIDGVKFGHAWLEDSDGMVYDYSNGREIILPKQIYYLIGKIEDKKPLLYKYTAEEARNKMAKSMHYGPWDLKTETGL